MLEGGLGSAVNNIGKILDVLHELFIVDQGDDDGRSISFRVGDELDGIAHGMKIGGCEGFARRFSSIG
jgi:hypothetical protein